ncbi:hypothetical protein PF005_g334 [Phytophthora fragariae]|uniref:PiggyBac transposable element-derived protein domain-containing protein n=2 Tax=Phytophthora fragariae TaxID=53985 RepID=A0A6A3ZQT0_9STRA|nr:hypothetical protein PF005_g334 [Phytophthora fragariae]
MMRDYYRWMGGVDVHDQLRLQRYSHQQQTKCKKYYKAVSIGLVDIVIVNAYVVIRDVQKARGANQDTHAQFLMQLQAQMLDVTEDDFAERQPQVDRAGIVSRTLPNEHIRRENSDFQIVNGQRKRRQYQCKVCPNRKPTVGERRATKFFCPGCSPSDKARTYLCNKVWPQYKKNTLTCHQIWHFVWNNGKDRPKPKCDRDIQNREAGTDGKRKRYRRVQSGEGYELAEDESRDEEEGGNIAPAVDSSAEEDVSDDEEDDGEQATPESNDIDPPSATASSERVEEPTGNGSSEHAEEMAAGGG